MALSSRSSLLALIALGSGHARAHPVDELVQTTFVTISREKVVLELTIVPGDAVAASYAAHHESAPTVLRDLTLSVDNQPLVLSATMAASDHYRLEAQLPALAPGKHTLRYENHHEPLKSGYLAASLLGENGVTIGLQTRDARQQSLTIPYTLARSPVSPLVWAVVGLLVACGLYTLRSRRR